MSNELNPFGSLEWRCIGPHRGGRVVAVAGDPTQPGTFYFGARPAASGRRPTAARYWENVSDGFFKTRLGRRASPSPSPIPNVIYAGMGESTIRGNVSHGDGVYKIDRRRRRPGALRPGRRRATSARSASTRRNPDLVYVAALGHAWGPNPERGVYRSQDGGADLGTGPPHRRQAGAIDLVLDPTNPRILYAALWEARRTRTSSISGGEGSGIWQVDRRRRHLDRITRNAGPAEGLMGKIGIAASPAQAGRVWALVEAEDGALFRSDDCGATWEAPATSADLRRRPWYYMHIFADPTTPKTVWVLNLELWKSTDGGKTFDAIPTPHGDNHDLWIDPQQPAAHDRGQRRRRAASPSTAGTWSSIYNQPTAQFYHVTTDNQMPYRVYGSQQDNTAMRAAERSSSTARSRWTDYVEPGGGESGYIAVSPTTPTSSSAAAIGTGAGHGRLIACEPDTRQKRNITVWPEVHGMGAGAESLKYRFQWTFPIVFSPHDPDALYVSLQRRAPLDRRGAQLGDHQPGPDAQRPGASIESVRRPDHERQHRRGDLLHDLRLPRVAARSAACFWAGSDDGLVHISRDGGAELGEHHAARPARVGADQHHRALAARPGDRLRRGHALQARRLRALPLSRRTTTGRPGRRSPTASPTTTSRASSARTRTGAACSTPAPRRASMSRSTTARNWQRLDGESAGRADPRPGRQGHRPGRRDARALASGSWTT